MKKEILGEIQKKVAVGGNIPTAVIEYNFELPKDMNIKKDSFYGVKARFNPKVKEGECNLIYTM